MVSPLKTWHHQEPKALWPALGGLALLTHIGVLGLSLPYVLTIMQPSKESTAVSIPIELIEVKSTAASTDSRSPLTESTNTSPAPTSQSTESLATRPPRIQPSEPATSAAPDNILTSPNDPTPVAQIQQPKPESTTQDSEDSTAQPVTPEETPSTGTPNLNTSENSTSENNISENGGSEANSAESTSEGESSETGPATLPSDGPTLPTPDADREEIDGKQVAYLSLVSHSHIPDSDLLTDIADSPATPIYEAINGIELSPQDVSCGEVSFSQSQVTYRVEVSPQGVLRDAVPWTGSIEPYSMSEEEEAISCLIVSAGFQFNPAIKDGGPVANSNLLLTIDIIESGLN